jgi:hypothetical protein
MWDFYVFVVSNNRGAVHRRLLLWVSYDAELGVKRT